MCYLDRLQGRTGSDGVRIQDLRLRKDKHALQRLAGEWLVDFKKQCQKPDFKVADYVEHSSWAHETNATSGRFGTPGE